MRVLIDACVLYPTILREIVLTLAGQGRFVPLWSPRILEEWQRVGVRRDGGEIAALEIESAKALFPDASVTPHLETEARLYLPDPDDVHVLAAAIDGQADEILTLNIKDFPSRVVSQHDLIVRHPDGFLLELFHQDPIAMRREVEAILSRAAEHGIDVSNPRGVLKRCRLPKLAKVLYGA